MTNGTADPQTARWHADKRFPVAMVLTIMIQTFGIVWVAAQAFFQLEELMKDVAATQARVGQLEAKLVVQDRTDAVIAEQLSATNENLSLLRADVRDTNELLRSLFQQRQRISP